MAVNEIAELSAYQLLGRGLSKVADMVVPAQFAKYGKLAFGAAVAAIPEITYVSPKIKTALQIAGTNVVASELEKIAEGFIGGAAAPAPTAAPLAAPAVIVPTPRRKFV